MDPAATLVELITDLAHGNMADSRESFQNLVDWIDAGGFLPNVEVQHHVNKIVVTVSR